MSMMHQGLCENCGYRTPEISDEGAWAVYLDDPIDSPGLSDDDRIVFLEHFRDALADNGYTWLSATLQGRLLRHARRVCTACGHHYEFRKLTASTLSGFVLAIVAGMAAG